MEARLPLSRLLFTLSTYYPGSGCFGFLQCVVLAVAAKQMASKSIRDTPRGSSFAGIQVVTCAYHCRVGDTHTYGAENDANNNNGGGDDRDLAAGASKPGKAHSVFFGNKFKFSSSFSKRAEPNFHFAATVQIEPTLAYLGCVTVTCEKLEANVFEEERKPMSL